MPAETKITSTRAKVLAAVGSFALFHIAQQAVLAYHLSRLREHTADAIRGLELQGKIFPLLSAVAGLALVIVLVALGQRPGARRRLLFIATAAIGVVSVMELVFWIGQVAEARWDVFGRWWWRGQSLALVVGIACTATALLLAMGLRGIGLACGLPLWVWVGWRTNHLIGELGGGRTSLFDWSLTTHLLFELATWGLGFAILLVLIARRGRALEGDRDDRLEYHRRWHSAAEGLKLYGDALSWRLAVTVIGYSMLLFAILGNSAGMAKLTAWLMPLVSVILGVAMLVGAFGFADQPDESPGKVPALFGAVGMLVGLCIDGYALIMTFKVFNAEPGSWQEAQHAATSAKSASMWAMGLGFAALAVTLISMAAVARHLRRAGLVKAITNAGILIAAAAIAALWFRSYLPESKMGKGEGVTLAMGIVIFAIVAVSYFISAVRRVEEAMRATGDPPAMDLPEARLVERGQDD